MDIQHEIARLVEQNQSFVVATVVKTGGSTPGKTGFKLVYRDIGETFGTVGGGAIEAEVIKECENRLRENANTLVEYLLSADGSAVENMVAVPMSCKGTLAVFYEIHESSCTVYVFGGGHVGSALLYHLKPLPFQAILIDNRKEFANPEKNPAADKIHLEDYISYANAFQPEEGSSFVILTHGHEFDLEIAKTILSRGLPFTYMGIIASHKKAEKIKTALKKELGDNLDLSRLFSPIGIKIGGDSAEEIAVSIVAELIKIK